MKNFRLLSLMAIAVVTILSMPAKAQQRVVTTPVLTQGNTLVYGGPNAATPSDSLQVSDSIAYFVPITHTNTVDPYITWIWTKIGAGTATVNLTFLQGNDGINWFPVPVGVAHAAYAKSYTLSASGVNNIDFAADSARFSGRYLKIYYITTATASVKGKLVGQLKSNIR